MKSIRKILREKACVTCEYGCKSGNECTEYLKYERELSLAYAEKLEGLKMDKVSANVFVDGNIVNDTITKCQDEIRRMK